MQVCATIHETHVLLLRLHWLLLLFGEIKSLLEHRNHHFVTREDPGEGDALSLEIAPKVRFNLGHFCLGLESGMVAPDELLRELHFRFDSLKEQVVCPDSQIVGYLRSQVTCSSVCNFKLFRIFFFDANC